MSDTDITTETKENRINFVSNPDEDAHHDRLVFVQSAFTDKEDKSSTIQPTLAAGVARAYLVQDEVKLNQRNEKIMIMPNAHLWRKPDLMRELAHKPQNRTNAANKQERKSLIEMGYYPPPDSKCVTPTKQKPICKIVVEMLRKGKFPDVMVRIGRLRYPCHLCLLQSHSDYFKDFQVGQEIVMPKGLIRENIFETIYRWMLTDEFLIPYDILVDFFHASTVLQIPELTKAGWCYFDCAKEHLREDQAFALYLEARKYQIHELQNALLRRITKFFLALVASKEFLQMDVDEVERLLSCNNIGINTEVEVFLSALRWINYDRVNRERHLEKLLACIRFGVIPAWYLLQIQNKTIGEDIEWIAKKECVNNSVRRAMIYSVAHQHYASSPEGFVQWLNEEGIDRINERQYVFDKGCVYHHRLRCPHMHLVTFNMFQNYLSEVDVVGRDHWRCVEHDMPDIPCTCMKKPKNSNAPN